MQLANKKALVTGASQGIGEAIALKLGSMGYTVGIHYHSNEQQADKVKLKILNSGGNAVAFRADMRNHDQVLKLADDSWDALNGIDILINNSGVSDKTHFLDTTEADFDHFNLVNYKSVFFLTQSIARKMVLSKSEGAVYTITSVNGIRPGYGFSAYGSSKGAVETLMKGVALELAHYNIRVNTIAAGAIQTDMNAAVLKDPKLLSQINNGIPMNRMGQPEEVAELITALLTSDSYLTGTSITLDGGLLLMRGYGKPDELSG